MGETPHASGHRHRWTAWQSYDEDGWTARRFCLGCDHEDRTEDPDWENRDYTV